MSRCMIWAHGSRGSGVNRDDSDHATDEDPRCDRSRGRQEGYRLAGPAVRREARDGSVFRLSVCFPKPSRHVDPSPLLRRTRILAGTKTFVEGPFSMVADRKAGGARAGSASGAVIVGGREPRNGGGTGVEESERVLALTFQKSMCDTPACLWNGNIVVASSPSTTFASS